MAVEQRGDVASGFFAVPQEMFEMRGDADVMAHDSRVAAAKAPAAAAHSHMRRPEK